MYLPFFEGVWFVSSRASASVIRYLPPKARLLGELGILLFCSPGFFYFVVLGVFCARFPPREASQVFGEVSQRPLDSGLSARGRSFFGISEKKTRIPEGEERA